MSKTVKWLTMTVALVLLGACGTQLQKAETVSPGDGAFNQALYKYYVQLSASEYGEGDYRDSDHFARKALHAAAGDNVLPDEVGSRHEPEDKISVLTSARARLLTALDGGGRDKAPDDAALAQTRFDCWLQEQEENFQPQDIEGCRQDFFAALRRVEAAIAPEPEPQAAPAPKPEPVEFVIYFDFDKANIRPDQEDPLDAARSAAQSAGGETISLTCHADTSGNIDYNQALSVRRCNTVTGRMIEAGVDRSRIISLPVGETQPRVDTGDGVPEQENRVVIMTFEAQ